MCKNSIIVVAVLFVSIVLSACSSAKYEDLERRVSALEERLATSSAVEDIVVTVNTNDTTEETEIESELTSEKSVESVYDLTSLTADEVINEITYYIDNRPKQNDSYEDISARFRVSPIRDIHDGDTGIRALFNSCCEFGIEDNDLTVTHDEILLINYTNARQAMNGSTVDVQKDRIGVSIFFCIQNYDKAEAVFSLLEDYFSSNDRYTYVEVNRDNGNEWMITYSIVREDGSGAYGGTGCETTMKQINNGYLFLIRIS